MTKARTVHEELARLTRRAENAERKRREYAAYVAELDEIAVKDATETLRKLDARSDRPRKGWETRRRNAASLAQVA